MIVRTLEDISSKYSKITFLDEPSNATNINIRNCVFLDIETSSGMKSFEETSEREQSLFIKKINKMLDFIEVEENEKNDYDQLYQKHAALFPEYGKITCISMGLYSKEGNFSILSFVNDDEETLLRNFVSFFNITCNRSEMTIVGGNIKFFDIPFIHRKCLAYGIRIPKFLYNSLAKPWEQNIFDIIEYYRSGSKIGDSTLDSLTRMMGIQSPKDAMSGEETSKAYWEGDIEKVAVYCEKDVKAAHDVFEKMTKVVNIVAKT